MRRRCDRGQPGGEAAAGPRRAEQGERAASRTRRAGANRGEHAVPGVPKPQRVVATAGVGDREDDRLGGQIEPARAPQRVGRVADMDERVERGPHLRSPESSSDARGAHPLIRVITTSSEPPGAIVSTRVIARGERGERQRRLGQHAGVALAEADRQERAPMDRDRDPRPHELDDLRGAGRVDVTGAQRWPPAPDRDQARRPRGRAAPPSRGRGPCRRRTRSLRSESRARRGRAPPGPGRRRPSCQAGTASTVTPAISTVSPTRTSRTSKLFSSLPTPTGATATAPSKRRSDGRSRWS